MPAARAPSTSLVQESPTITASSGRARARSSATSKMRAAGFDTPTSSETTRTSTWRSRPQWRSFSCCSCSRLLETITTVARARTASRNGSCPVDRLARLQVTGAIGRCRPCRQAGVGRHPRRTIQPPETLDARGVQIETSGEHLQVQFFEDLRVGSSRALPRPRRRDPVKCANTEQRLARAVLVIKKGVVEIQQHRANRSRRFHFVIVSRAPPRVATTASPTRSAASPTGLIDLAPCQPSSLPPPT